MSPTAQRVVGVVVLLVLGMLALPVSASLIDGEGAENWIIVLDLAAMAAFGAAVTIALSRMPARSLRGLRPRISRTRPAAITP